MAFHFLRGIHGKVAHAGSYKAIKRGASGWFDEVYVYVNRIRNIFMENCF